jgi:hypothetical protein
VKTLSRTALEELGILQAALRRPAEDRNLALRIFAASRNAATRAAQQEFWLEFSWLDQDHADGPRLRAQR